MQHSKVCFFVDDDEDDREIFMMAVAETGVQVQVVTAINGRDAMKKIESNKAFIPDFIFIDLNMPFMGGCELLQEIKKVNRLKEVPVYIYTTSSSQRDKAEAAALGAVDFIIKPSSVSLLAEILVKVLNTIPSHY